MGAATQREVVDRWVHSHPQVSEWLETALEDGLACFAFPEEHRRRIRSTNGLERFNQELERRTRVVRIFPNPEACLRLVTALCMEQSEEWLAGSVYLDMRKLDAAGDDQVPLATVVAEEVKNMAAPCSRACGREGGAKVHRLRALTSALIYLRR